MNELCDSTQPIDTLQKRQHIHFKTIQYLLFTFLFTFFWTSKVIISSFTYQVLYLNMASQTSQENYACSITFLCPEISILLSLLGQLACWHGRSSFHMSASSCVLWLHCHMILNHAFLSPGFPLHSCINLFLIACNRASKSIPWHVTHVTMSHVLCPLAATHLFWLFVKDTAVRWCPCCPCDFHTITPSRKGMKPIGPTEQWYRASREIKSCLSHNDDTNTSDTDYNGNISHVTFS